MDMQNGSLIRKSRSHGSDAWLFRWSEKDDDGNVGVATWFATENPLGRKLDYRIGF
jgi:hypothetical protein